MKNKKGLITKVIVQDGRLINEFLLQKGYELYGLKGIVLSFYSERINPICCILCEVDSLLGDFKKTEIKCGWKS